MSFLLAGAGFVVASFVHYHSRWRRFEDDDREKLDVLYGQIFVVYTVAVIIQLVWSPVAAATAPPLFVTLAGIGTAMMATEAFLIFRRGVRTV